MSLNEALKIKQFKALNLTCENEQVFIYGELQETEKTCPECGQEALKPHQYYQKRVRHLPILNKPTYLVFERKDWICSCGKVFLERLDFQDLKRQYTNAYEEYVYELGRKQDLHRVAELEGLSRDIIEAIFFKSSPSERKARSKPRSNRLKDAPFR